MLLATSPAWLSRAFADIGIVETPGAASNPRVIAYYRDAGHPEVASDAVAWCAAFVGAILARAGIAPSGSLLARSYLDWGQSLGADLIDAARFGAIAVLSRGGDPSLGHVGFLLAVTDTHVILLGGNQSDAVGIEAFARDRLLALRWPVDTVATLPPPAETPDIFALALDHVLAMEGGYTDDPHDPGGPTNLGITLATLAAWQRISISDDTIAALKSDITRLDRAAVRPIYLARYWRPSLAAELPAPLALFHFDASVNHGVAGAARMLQAALGVVVDGEIGPDTIAAAAATSTAQSLAAYAAIRRARYRALPHFRYFGRGWLSRVDQTFAAATTLAGDARLPTPRKETAMPDASTSAPLDATSTPKWWGNSLTIWGALITALATVLPALGPLLGIDISAAMIRELGQGLAQAVQAIGGVLGTVMAIYGRVRAVQPLMRRDVLLRL